MEIKPFNNQAFFTQMNTQMKRLMLHSPFSLITPTLKNQNLCSTLCPSTGTVLFSYQWITPPRPLFSKLLQTSFCNLPDPGFKRDPYYISLGLSQLPSKLAFMLLSLSIQVHPKHCYLSYFPKPNTWLCFFLLKNPLVDSLLLTE